MLTIVVFLNVLAENLRKKLTDTFPVILSTPHRQDEYFLLIEKMLESIIRMSLKYSITNSGIEDCATTAFDSFLQLLKFGYEDHFAMPYDILYKKTNFLTTQFFDWLEYINTDWLKQNIDLYNSRSKELDYVYRLDVENIPSIPIFSIEKESNDFNSNNGIWIYFDDRPFLMVSKIDELKLFNLEEEDFPFLFDKKELSFAEIESINIENKIEQKKIYSSEKRNKRKLRNSIIFI